MTKTKLLGTHVWAFSLLFAPTLAMSEQMQPIDIPAQPLANAIKELGAETGLRIAAHAHAIDGKESRAVRGPMTPSVALQQLLEGTGLSVRHVGEDGAVVAMNLASQNSTVSEFDLGTIVLQGERVERDVFSTSSSVRAYGGEEIEQDVQNTNFEQLINGAANVNSQGISNGTPVIRGIDTAGPGGAVSGVIPRATVTVDGRAITADEFRYGITSIWDVETVEIFRGPQTTSLGANSIAGAINIRTRDPVFSNEGAIRLEAGSEDRFLGALMANGALSDSVALRFTYERQQEDAYINFPAGLPAGSEAAEIELTTSRLKLLWEPVDIPQMRNKLTFSYTDFSRPQTQIVVGPDFDELISNNTDGFPGAFTGETRALIHDFDYDFGSGFAIRNQLQYSEAEIARVTGAPGEQTLPIDSENVTNELILDYAPDNGALSGVVGLFYQDTDDESEAFELTDEKDSRGVFGEMTYDFGNGFDATAGLRYQRNRQKRQASLPFGANLDFDETFDAWLPKVAVGYEPNEDLRFSFQASRGFNPGGIGGSLLGILGVIPIADPFFAFDEETVTNIEFGMRGRFLDQRLFVAANLFYSDFENYQFGVPTLLPGGFVDTIVTNAEGVETYGLEVEGQFQANDRLTLTGAVGLLQTEVTDFDNSANDLIGNSLPNAPEYSIAVGFNYAVTNRFDIGGQLRHTDGYFSDIENSDEFEVSSRTLVDLRASYDVTERVEAYFYVNNVFDEITPLFLFDSNGSTAGATTIPREFGIGLRAVF